MNRQICRVFCTATDTTSSSVSTGGGTTMGCGPPKHCARAPTRIVTGGGNATTSCPSPVRGVPCGACREAAIKAARVAGTPAATTVGTTRGTFRGGTPCKGASNGSSGWSTPAPLGEHDRGGLAARGASIATRRTASPASTSGTCAPPFLTSTATATCEIGVVP